MPHLPFETLNGSDQPCAVLQRAAEKCFRKYCAAARIEASVSDLFFRCIVVPRINTGAVPRPLCNVFNGREGSPPAYLQAQDRFAFVARNIGREREYGLARRTAADDPKKPAIARGGGQRFPRPGDQYFRGLGKRFLG